MITQGARTDAQLLLVVRVLKPSRDRDKDVAARDRGSKDHNANGLHCADTEHAVEISRLVLATRLSETHDFRGTGQAKLKRSTAETLPGP